MRWERYGLSGEVDYHTASQMYDCIVCTYASTYYACASLPGVRAGEQLDTNSEKKDTLIPLQEALSENIGSRRNTSHSVCTARRAGR